MIDSPIGVFDSGIGGLSILRSLKAALPDEHFVYLSDSAHSPYGERGDAFVSARSHAITQQLRDEHGIKALVIACNTATAAAIHSLREAFPGMPFIGVEPALKPAALLSHTGHIGVLATRGTVHSAKFQALLAQVQTTTSSRFSVQACDGLAAAIEASVQQSDATAESTPETRALLARYISAMGHFGTQHGAIDTLVLGCTHYALALAPLQALVGPSVQVLDNGPAIARQTQRLLAAASLLAPPGGKEGSSIQWLATGDSAPLLAAANRWLPG